MVPLGTSFPNSRTMYLGKVASKCRKIILTFRVIKQTTKNLRKLGNPNVSRKIFQGDPVRGRKVRMTPCAGDGGTTIGLTAVVEDLLLLLLLLKLWNYTTK
mmetsp:Transcript_16237/g.26421  ORF Transcript_16237/g.26421 Transcript_16237/m.26421 type:complete len:101 (-) Transcript_16237:76-378(-)